MIFGRKLFLINRVFFFLPHHFENKLVFLKMKNGRGGGRKATPSKQIKLYLKQQTLSKKNKQKNPPHKQNKTPEN